MAKKKSIKSVKKSKDYKLFFSFSFRMKLHNYPSSVSIIIKSEIAKKHPHQFFRKAFILFPKEREIAFTKYCPDTLCQSFVRDSY